MVKYQAVSKYYDHDGLQSFFFLIIYLLAAPIVKNSHFLAESYFIFLKKVLDQT